MDGDFRGAPARRDDTTQRGARQGGPGWHDGRGGPRRSPGDPAPHAAAPPPVGGAARALPAHDVRQLMRNGTQAVLMLDGIAYSLRITRAGKLILTK
jgi:hemin uptake protein HemP